MADSKFIKMFLSIKRISLIYLHEPYVRLLFYFHYCKSKVLYSSASSPKFVEKTELKKDIGNKQVKYSKFYRDSLLVVISF